MSAHGTRSTYVNQHCDCVDCTAANSRYQTHRNRRINRPDATWAPHGDINRVKAHIGRLSAAGFGTRQISTVSGVARSTINQILNGTSESVRADTADRLLAVDPARRDAGRVDKTRPAIIIAVHRAAGWTLAQIAERADLPVDAVRLRGTTVLAATAAHLDEFARSTGLTLDRDHNIIRTPAPPPVAR